MDGERSCAYKNWDITGMPCKHTIATMYDNMQNGSACGDPENWVNKLAHVIVCGQDPIVQQPLSHTNITNRPKKKKKKMETGESSHSISLSRKYLIVTCSKGHKEGHNSRTCNVTS
uniref:SWIM-type domain-containing protein n=1 Tax=Lactuca sativa TaxID=4236 RepID=A0A9R1WMZ7_LACSA|nr:hypothetical protein LSAT_V11C100012870 [Lactuca sativa]